MLVSGCIDGFDPASFISEPRVLAARVEVQEEPERAWPRPQERVEMPWLIVGPDEPPRLTWAFIACAAAPVRFGAPRCEGAPLRNFFPCQDEPVVEPPRFELSVPGDDALGGAEELLVAGVFCAKGRLPFSCESPPTGPDGLGELACEGEDARTTPVVRTISLARGEQTNHNPEIAEVLRNGVPWEAPPDAALVAPRDGCPADLPLPIAEPGGDEQQITIRTREESRETFTAERGDPPEPRQMREEMLVSSFTTAGDIERRFSKIDEEGALETTVGWTSPGAGDVPDEGVLARFHFVMRDQRGGAAWVTRALCIK